MRENWTTLETDVLVAGAWQRLRSRARRRAITVVFPGPMVHNQTDVVKLLGKVVE